MKFGKRLAAEAARRWLDHYFDYKEQKRAIQDDIAARGVQDPMLRCGFGRVVTAPLISISGAADPQGRHFQAAIQAQLEKISKFYRAKELQLEVRAPGCLLMYLRPLDKTFDLRLRSSIAFPEQEALRSQGKPGARALTVFRADCADLRKYAVVRPALLHEAAGRVHVLTCCLM